MIHGEGEVEPKIPSPKKQRHFGIQFFLFLFLKISLPNIFVTKSFSRYINVLYRIWVRRVQTGGGTPPPTPNSHVKILKLIVYKCTSSSEKLGTYVTNSTTFPRLLPRLVLQNMVWYQVNSILCPTIEINEIFLTSSGGVIQANDANNVSVLVYKLVVMLVTFFDFWYEAVLANIFFDRFLANIIPKL